jgi:hypothetical protein
MKKFENLGIEQPRQRFEGEKVSIYDILNKEIQVHKFKIGPSKYQDKGMSDCMDLQIKVDEIDRVMFTGSGILMEQIKSVKAEDFPFTTTIIKLNPKGFRFT